MLHLRENENKQTKKQPFKKFAKCILSIAQKFILGVLRSVL